MYKGYVTVFCPIIISLWISSWLWGRLNRKGLSSRDLYRLPQLCSVSRWMMWDFSSFRLVQGGEWHYTACIHVQVEGRAPGPGGDWLVPSVLGWDGVHRWGACEPLLPGLPGVVHWGWCRWGHAFYHLQVHGNSSCSTQGKVNCWMALWWHPRGIYLSWSHYSFICFWFHWWSGAQWVRFHFQFFITTIRCHFLYRILQVFILACFICCSCN